MKKSSWLIIIMLTIIVFCIGVGVVAFEGFNLQQDSKEAITVGLIFFALAAEIITLNQYGVFDVKDSVHHCPNCKICKKHQIEYADRDRAL